MQPLRCSLRRKSSQTLSSHAVGVDVDVDVDLAQNPTSKGGKLNMILHCQEQTLVEGELAETGVSGEAEQERPS